MHWLSLGAPPHSADATWMNEHARTTHKGSKANMRYQLPNQRLPHSPEKEAEEPQEIAEVGGEKSSGHAGESPIGMESPSMRLSSLSHKDVPPFNNTTVYFSKENEVLL